MRKAFRNAETSHYARVKVPDDVRERLEAALAPVLARHRRYHCKRSRHPDLNWPADVFARWHRDALYIVVVMQTPHGLPPTFESHHARMRYIGDGLFDLAIPMRRGWNTILVKGTVEECARIADELSLP